MTALFMFSDSNRFVMASDGIAYDDDGVVRQIHSKQIVRPDINFGACISSSGPAYAVLRLLLIDVNPLSFDEIHVVLPDLARKTVDVLERNRMGQQIFNEQYVLVQYGGYSEREERFVSYILSSRTQGGTLNPYEPARTWAYHSRDIRDDIRAACGICREDVRGDVVRDGPWLYAVKTIFGARHTQGTAGGPDGVPACVVGGFIELTTLQRDHATTSIVCRWPDEVGRIAEPEKDPPFFPLSFGSGPAWTPPDPRTLYDLPEP